ncbi:MAG TPA: hypothetical protein VF660_12230, partial [Actinomycetota bacterium]
MDVRIRKGVKPSTNVVAGDNLEHTLTITAFSRTPTGGPFVNCGPLNITVQDFATPNQTFSSSSGPGTCTAGVGVTCTFTIADVPVTGQTNVIKLEFTAGTPGPYCDNATAIPTNAIDDDPSNNNTGSPTCAQEAGATTPPPDGGGGGFGDDDGFGGGFGGFGSF